MNKIVNFSLFTFTFSLFTCFGAANDTLISFSTPGPDKYADGATVLDGECYALVWTKTGATFAGIAADGKVVDAANSAVLVYAPVAKGGRCPTVVFELDADFAAQYAGGSFGVYLLDTRLANGKVGGVNANGLPVAVNGYGEVRSKKEEGRSADAAGSFADLSSTSTSDSSSVAVTTKSALPADAPQPQITSIKVVGANVVLTVKNTLSCLKYAASEVSLEGKSKSEEVKSEDSQAAAQGAGSVDEEITVIVPKKGDSGFFKISRE